MQTDFEAIIRADAHAALLRECLTALNCIPNKAYTDAHGRRQSTYGLAAKIGKASREYSYTNAATFTPEDIAVIRHRMARGMAITTSKYDAIDAQLMLARTEASLRGATPVEVQRNVLSLAVAECESCAALAHLVNGRCDTCR